MLEKLAPSSVVPHLSTGDAATGCNHQIGGGEKSIVPNPPTSGKKPVQPPNGVK
jgi:hypothetical protein